MKRLMFLISTEGKTPQKISAESMAAYQKYQEVSAKVAKEVEGKEKQIKKTIIKI